MSTWLLLNAILGCPVGTKTLILNNEFIAILLKDLLALKSLALNHESFAILLDPPAGTHTLDPEPGIKGIHDMPLCL